MEGPQGVEIEINVRIKLLQVFVCAAPDVVAIVNQPWDLYQGAQPVEERTRAHQAIELRIRPGDAGHVREHGLAAYFAVFGDSIARIEGGKLLDQSRAQIRVKEIVYIVYDDVPKRLGSGEFPAEGLCAVANRWVNPVEHGGESAYGFIRSSLR
jgi:hypothetical protein